METHQLVEATTADFTKIVALVNIAYRSKILKGWTSEADLVQGNRINVEQLKTLVNEAHKIFILKDGERIIGCVQMNIQQKCCFLGMLTIHPDFQNQGLGKVVLQFAERYAIQHHDVDSFEICVLNQRKLLIQFYQRRGYCITHKKAPYPVDQNVGKPYLADLFLLYLTKKLPFLHKF